MRILLIDDEVKLLKTIQLGWPDETDEIVTAQSFADVRQIIFSSRLLEFDCVIVDLRLPDASGSMILSEIRQIAKVPVIMLSAWGDTRFRADTLNSGADDYVMKPVGVEELHARVRKLVDSADRSQLPAGKTYEIGRLAFDPNSRLLTGPGEACSLTGAEAALLSSLAAAGGGIVSRERLYLKAFGREGRYGEKSLETYVGRLRRKMSEAGDEGNRRLLSVRGKGYRLVTTA
ncbi:response regulator transcription factor [Henriciella aquimarina]|uniref:response regulator transcription factor n=1 Tax=Henriciella aquimarina TaxID=545261 RepID=UPI0009FFF3D8|nr:response regulator transcription factor [Henriciella aquimarina]